MNDAPLTNEQLTHHISFLIQSQGAIAAALILIEQDGKRAEVVCGFDHELSDIDERTPDWMAAKLRKVADSLEGGGGIPVGKGHHTVPHGTTMPESFGAATQSPKDELAITLREAWNKFAERHSLNALPAEDLIHARFTFVSGAACATGAFLAILMQPPETHQALVNEFRRQLSAMRDQVTADLAKNDRQ